MISGSIWNIESQTRIATLNGHTDVVFCLSVLKNGKSEDNSIKIWSTNNNN
jgi:WD40 repeat protein